MQVAKRHKQEIGQMIEEMNMMRMWLKAENEVISYQSKDKLLAAIHSHCR